MLPGLSRMQWAPASIAFSARVWLKWMSAITGIGESLTIVFSASTSWSRGTATRTRSAPASATLPICSMVASRLAVSVLVIVCTATGAPPPIGTPPTKIWRFEAMIQGYLRLNPNRGTAVYGRTGALTSSKAALRPAGRLRRVDAAIFAPPASAVFHLMKVREVYPGSAAAPDFRFRRPADDLRRCRTSSAATRSRLYGATGSLSATVPMGQTVDEGANQSTILLAGSGYAAAFPSGPAADFTDADLNLSPAGGAVCFPDGIPADCVSWGSFTPPVAGLPSHPGPNASPDGIPDGMALTRSISAGCATLLESGDDTDTSAADFAETSPTPRANSTPPSEHACTRLHLVRRPGSSPGRRARPPTAPRPSASPPASPVAAFAASSTAGPSRAAPLPRPTAGSGSARTDSRSRR